MTRFAKSSEINICVLCYHISREHQRVSLFLIFTSRIKKNMELMVNSMFSVTMFKNSVVVIIIKDPFSPRLLQIMVSRGIVKRSY